MGKIHDFFWDTPQPIFTSKDSCLVGNKILMAYRIFALLAMIFIYSWTARLNEWIFLPMEFLTYWGITSVGLYFAGACLCYLVYRDESKIDIANPYAFWKFVNILGEFAFSIEILIPPFFWAFLYPPAAKEYVGAKFWATVCAHLFTGMFIWIETILNKNKFYKKHIIIVIVLAIIYLIINCVYTETTGTPVYSTMTWKSIATLYYSLVATVLLCIGFVIGLGLTWWKYRNAPLQRSVKDSMATEAKLALL